MLRDYVHSTTQHDSLGEKSCTFHLNAEYCDRCPLTCAESHRCQHLCSPRALGAVCAHAKLKGVQIISTSASWSKIYSKCTLFKKKNYNTLQSKYRLPLNRACLCSRCEVRSVKDLKKRMSSATQMLTECQKAGTHLVW